MCFSVLQYAVLHFTDCTLLYCTAIHNDVICNALQCTSLHSTALVKAAASSHVSIFLSVLYHSFCPYSGPPYLLHLNHQSSSHSSILIIPALILYSLLSLTLLLLSILFYNPILLTLLYCSLPYIAHSPMLLTSKLLSVSLLHGR